MAITVKGDDSNCGLSHITGIVSYAGKPKEVLVDFCKKIQIPDRDGFGLAVRGQKLPILQGLYTFSGKFTDKHGSPVNYGTGLAAYIRAHKLGRVRASMTAVNTQYSDGHLIRVWIWAPDQAAMNKFYKEHVNVS